MRYKDITGKRFGKLIAIKSTGRKAEQEYWLCKCDCGGEKIVRKTLLANGKTKSCGCIWRKKKPNTRHSERLYRIFAGIKDRCFNKNTPAYCNYGGRGITMCADWYDYEVFKKWSLENGYAPNLSIDRIDNNKGYSPDNCRWATRDEQSRNKRNNHFYNYDGKSMILEDWARFLGIKCHVLLNRISRGMPYDKVFTKSVRKNKLGYKGITKNKYNKYIVFICGNGSKTIKIGCFDTLEKAIEVHKKAKEKKDLLFELYVPLNDRGHTENYDKFLELKKSIIGEAV